MPTSPTMIPPDDLKRSLKLAQPDNLPHIGLVGDTYTITVTGEDTNGRFCVIDMHIPPGGGPPPHRGATGESSFEKAGRRFQVLHWPPYYLRALRERKTLRLPIFRTLPCPEW